MVAFVTIKDQQTIATIRSLGYIIYQYYADIWVFVFTGYAYKYRKARKASISDATKREYAAATGADLDALLGDCAYKEQYRPALTAFFKEQMRQQPQLPEKHFLNVLSDAADMDQRGTTWSEGFANKCLLPLFHKDLERLASMVVPVPDFPRPGIEFQHMLNIAQRQGGLALCTSLLRTRFKGD
ncbi:hypothetical protein FocTR4_00012197 [Fusarium oxysporum f. sp. cubense]|nr:hypothetical protein FocTR4_00012197 [Fusarium oxysporum f. sp. cubense]